MSGPCHFVIFGAAGHLNRTKLLPALYHLERAGRLEAPLAFVATARREWDTNAWRQQAASWLEDRLGKELDRAILQRFLARFDFIRGDHTDPGCYRALLEEISRPRPGVCENVVFYLAIRPDDFVTVVRNLADAGLNSVIGEHRIVVEKPFGRDLRSAQQLNADLHRYFNEDQVFRIDHYLGKETVQNILVLRFANSVIEPLWNRHHIDHVQITAAESAGIGTRAGYFDRSGTLRDMLQNHLLQIMTVVAMEPPASLDADALRDEKVKVLRSIRPIAADEVEQAAVRAQYRTSDDGRIAAYLTEEGVPPESITETYAAVKLYVDNWRWRGVPFYLRSGKRLQAQRSAIAIRFRHPPQQLFSHTPCADVGSNWLTIQIQPDEDIQFELYAREPGLTMTPRLVELNTAYRDPSEVRLDAYETLLLDVVRGDRSLFIRFDEVEQAWRIVDPILNAWQRSDHPIAEYAAGSWGPDATESLLDHPEHAWRNDL